MTVFIGDAASLHACFEQTAIFDRLGEIKQGFAFEQYSTIYQILAQRQTLHRNRDVFEITQCFQHTAAAFAVIDNHGY